MEIDKVFEAIRVYITAKTVYNLQKISVPGVWFDAELAGVSMHVKFRLGTEASQASFTGI